jgi:hypothetical protein
MENGKQKPPTDLERIQKSYTSGSQVYVADVDPTPARPDAPEGRSIVGYGLGLPQRMAQSVSEVRTRPFPVSIRGLLRHG